MEIYQYDLCADDVKLYHETNAVSWNNWSTNLKTEPQDAPEGNELGNDIFAWKCQSEG